MKFGKNFESLLTSEWRQQYMEYGILKDMIKRAMDDAPSPSSSEYTLETYYQRFKDAFFTECTFELQKVNNFFLEKMAESSRKFALLKIQLETTIMKHTNVSGHSLRSLRTHIENPKPQKLSHLRFALSEFYLSLILLQNYQALNFTAFRKICKKYDKNFRVNDGSEWFQENIEGAPFIQSPQLTQMTEGIENLYTEYLADGDRSRAMTKLRVPPLGEPTKSSLIFRAGFSLGMFIVLAIVMIISCYSVKPKSEHSDAFTSLYRGPFTWVLVMFFMAINIAGFQHYGVNYILIFEIDPRNHLQPANYLEYASYFGIIWSLSILGFIFNESLNVDPFIFPLILTVLMFGLLINPLPIMNSQSRFWLLRLVGRVISAPLHYVGFADFWLGDQMNSLVICIADYYFSINFFIKYWIGKHEIEDCFTEDYFVVIARCLPAWFRFAQCLRRYFQSGSKSVSYLINAGKYSTSFAVAFFWTLMTMTSNNYTNLFANPYVWCYLISALISTIYCIAWDYIRDFGIFKVCSGSKMFLRETLVYPMFLYYFAIIENFLIRFFWAFEFYNVQNHVFSSYVLKTVASILEVFRRFIWNFLRLENEHLNNCGRFRATRDIFVAPINAYDEKLLEYMMDEEDGVQNRQKHKDNESIDKKFF